MQFFKKMLIYVIGNLLPKMVYLLLLPLYTKHLPVGDYGSMDALLALLAVLEILCFLDIHTGIMRFMFDRAEDRGKRELAGYGVALQLPLSLLYLAAVLILGLFTPLFSWPLCFAYGLSVALNNVFQFSVRGLGRTMDYSISGMINMGVQLLVSFAAILGFGMGVMALLIAPVAGNLCSIVYLQLRTRVFAVSSLRRTAGLVTRPLLAYCAPLMVNSTATWALTNYTRVYVKEAMSAEANGIYAVVYKFSMIVMLVISVFALAWQETTFQQSGASLADKSRSYSRMLRYFLPASILFTALATSGVCIVFPWMIHAQYGEALRYIPLSFVAAMVNMLTVFQGQIFTGEKKTGVILYSTLLAAAVNIVSLYLLLPVMGLYAAPVSLLLGYMANALHRSFVMKKIVPLTIHWPALGWLAAVGIAYALAVYGERWMHYGFCAALCALAALVYRRELTGLLRGLLQSKFSAAGGDKP